MIVDVNNKIYLLEIDWFMEYIGEHTTVMIEFGLILII